MQRGAFAAAAHGGLVPSAAGTETGQQPAQARQVNGLCQVGIHAALQRLFPVFFKGVGRHGNNGHRCGIRPGQRPNGLRRLIPGHAVYEACQFYHTYTDEEIKRMEEQAAAEQAAKDREERIARIDSIDAQVTYTAMMTDTLMEETDSGEGSGSDGAADSTDSKEA